MQETTAIEGMLMDLSRGDCPTHLATLGLTDYVAQLADANNRYVALEAQRTVSNSDAKAPDSKTIRTEMDALYAYITDVAFAHQVLNPTTELARYIRDVNDMIADGKTAAANEAMASVAGSSIATMGMALSSDVERQLRAIRNRTTTMGVNQTGVNEGLP